MFGHQDDQKHDDSTMPEPEHDGVLGHDEHSNAVPTVVSDDVTGDDAPVNPALPADTSMFGAAPADDDTHKDEVEDNVPAADSPAPSEPTDDSDTLPTHDSAGTNDLLDIKTQALQQLTPLVDHLDQSPEEKFRTTMMMIQASDDQSLVKTAYEAAKDITDEKAKAQALLDIVNEINYFTHNQASD